MKLSDVEMSVVEFLWKVVIILFFIVPICVGGTAFVFRGLSPSPDFIVVACFTVAGAVIGTVAALFITSAIIKFGHKD